MMDIDGSMGEGGGQLLRTALTLAMCTGVPIRLRHIRARRARPGLRAQHLAAVRAAAAICSARVSGATLASAELEFAPGAVRPGEYDIDVGTAGSTLLVLQTILLPLSFCGAPSTVVLRGGTHNPLAPTFEFVRDAWLPLIGQLGFRARLVLERHGFIPQGGGVIRASIEPRLPGRVLELMERGSVRRCSVQVLLSRLPEDIGRREVATLRARLAVPEQACSVETVAAAGAGNALHVRLDCAHLTTLFAGFGRRGVPAETVADRTAAEVRRYLDADVALDQHLADQLLLPLALSAGGRFSSLAPSGHTTTNAAVIGLFLPSTYEAQEIGPGRWTVALRTGGAGAQPVACRPPRTK
jgi:RNA 3'-terminal phosphate cyclase (ATP)